MNNQKQAYNSNHNSVLAPVMAAYIRLGIEGKYLISASIMSAPAALAVSKLLYPETEQSKTTTDDIRMQEG